MSNSRTTRSLLPTSLGVAVLVAAALCLANCRPTGPNLPVEGDSCDGREDSFCLSSDQPDLMWCEDDNVYKLYDCEDVCGESGWSGSCSNDSERGHHVCWCLPSDTPSSVQIGDLNLTMEAGTLSPDPMPSPTYEGGEPVIQGYTVISTGDASFAVDFDVLSDFPITQVHFDMNGGHYIADVSSDSGSADIDACQILAKAQGYDCTQACLDACACVTCDSAETESNLEQGCSVSCSVSAATGQIGAGQIYENEIIFADIAYNGNAVVDGVLDSQPSCGGGECRAAADAQKVVRVNFGFVETDYGFIDDMAVGAIMTESQPPGPRPSLRSTNLTPGTWNQDVRDACYPY